MLNRSARCATRCKKSIRQSIMSIFSATNLRRKHDKRLKRISSVRNRKRQLFSTEEPGKCPICGMELVPVMKKAETEKGRNGETAQSHGSPSRPPTDSPVHEFLVPVQRQQQIGVTYATVIRARLHHTIRAVGTVEP